MKQTNNNPHKFCFISISGQNYLTEYINISPHDLVLDFSFKNINLLELKNYEPNMIIIDEYFKDAKYTAVINAIKRNFKHVKIYFLSPEYANYNGTNLSIDKQNHHYSNLSLDILNHINTLIKNN